MGFNKIMNTILKFRKLAAKNNIDQQIHEKYPRYKKLLQLRDNFETLSDEDNKFIKDFEKLLDQATKEEDTTDYNLSDTSSTSFNKYDRVIQQSHKPMDDMVNELIENPLFPYVLRSRVERNTFNDQDAKSEIERIEKYLKKNKDTFERYQAYLEKINSIIRYNDYLQKTINNNQSDIEQFRQQIADNDNEIQQLSKKCDSADKDLDAPQQDETGETYTYRDYYNQVINDNIALLDLYNVGIKKSKYENLYNSITDRIAEMEDFLRTMEDTASNQTQDYENIKDKKSRLENIDLPIARQQYLIADAIVKQDSKNISQDKDGFDLYDYIDAIEYNQELKDLTKRLINKTIDLLPHIDKSNSKNWPWNDIEEQMPDIYKIKVYIDTLQNSRKRIKNLNEEQTSLNNNINRLTHDNKNYEKQLQNNEEQYMKAEDMTRTQDYKDRQKIVTEYIEHREYLGTLQRAYNILAKGGKENKKIPDEQTRIEQLIESIKAAEQAIGATQVDYENALAVNSGSRSIKDNLIIQNYEKAQKELDQNRIKLRNLQRTNTEKLDAVNAAKIDYKKIADKIIKRLTSKQSLLGILLTQSINKFVSYYLANNNYQAPDLSAKMRLLHYYMADGAPDKNIRLQDLKDFQDSDKNLELLQAITSVLMKESKDNIMAIFISILKNDFNEIYKSYNLSTVDNTKLFIVNQDTQERMGPYTSSEIKATLLLDKNPNIDDVITRVVNGKEQKFKIVEDKLTGDQIYNLLKNDDQQEIKKIFDKVKIEIQEYIRNELQYKSFEICNNPGNNFYSVMLAQAIQDDIADSINVNTLEQFLTSTKSNKNNIKALNKAYFGQTVDKFIDEVIKQLCKNFNTDNEYHMFVQFLQLYNVQNDDMNKSNEESNTDYYERLKKTYGKSFNIFKSELESIIKKHISLCKKELQIRDSEKYKMLTSQDMSEKMQEHFDILNGYIDENGKQVFGLISQINTIEHELQARETELYNTLVRTVQDKFSTIDNAMIKNLFDNLIIKLIRGNDNIDEYINNQLATMNYKTPAKTRQLSTSIQRKKENTINILQALQTTNLSRRIKEYRQQYQEYKELLKSKKHEEGYIASEAKEQKMQAKQNSLLIELQTLYTKLYGAKYNPLTKLLKKEQLRVRSENNENLTDAQQQLLYHLNDPDVTRRYMQSFDMNKFINMLSAEKNIQGAGLYGQLVAYDRKKEETLKKIQENLNKIAKLKEEKVNYEQANNQEEINRVEKAINDLEKLNGDNSVLIKGYEEDCKNLFNNTIQPIRQRIQMLEQTSSNLITTINTYDDAEGIGDLNNNKLNDQEGYLVSLYTTLVDIQAHNDSAAKIQQDVNKQEQSQRTHMQPIDSIFELTNNSKSKTKYEQRRANEENDENMNDELSFNNREGDYQHSFIHLDNPEQDNFSSEKDQDYNKIMKLYWENPEQLGDLLFDIDKSDAKKWMDEYIKNPASIRNPAYRPSKETVDAYLQE